MTWLLRCAVFLAVAAFVSEAQAYLLCTAPSEPYCLSGSGYFSDQYAFQSCRRDVESFVEETNAYVRCLSNESDEAIEKANDVIEHFNCRAEGQSFCY